MKFDKWQRDFLNCKSDKILCCGRQIGKSVICAIDAGEFAVHHPKTNTLMIAPTERQSYALFEKTLNYIASKYPAKIKKGKDRPTMTRIKLTNGSVIWCLPIGSQGTGVRFMTCHRLYGEEASRIGRDIWTAVLPMMLTTGGATVLLSTPAGRDNYFADVAENKDGLYNSFTRFFKSSEEVMRDREICETWTEKQREYALTYLKQCKSRMTKLEYAQEFEGRILDELMQLIPTELIKTAMVRDRNMPIPRGLRYMGADLAAEGKDQTVLLSVARADNEMIRMFDMEITSRDYTTSTTARIKMQDQKYDYNQIYLDTGGLGISIFHTLLFDTQTKRKVVSLNNAKRATSPDGKKLMGLTKEHLYSNLVHLLEGRKLELWNDPEIMVSLASIQYEYIDTPKMGRIMHIFGDHKYSHIAEALIRACYCSTIKKHRIWIR